MRITPYFATVTLLLASGSAFGASKEQLEMQRDIAQMQAQLQAIQSLLDQKLSAIQTLDQQTLDRASQANTSVSVLSAGVTSTLERELRQALTPIAGLAAKIDNTNNDMAEVRNQVQDLNTSLNKVLQILNDIRNDMKVMAVPAAPPPPTAMGGGASSAPPPPADDLFTGAFRDENGGKYDLAVGEYQSFIKNYPDDPNVVKAQYNIGNCHYTQQKYDLAAADFDVLIDKYPTDQVMVPQAYFMKGMSLKNTNKLDAVKTWRALIAKYPHSDAAAQAKEQLRAAGVSATATAPAGKRKPR